MYLADKKGNIIGVQDSKDKSRINLVKSDLKVLCIKISDANRYNFHHFVYTNGDGDEITIPMNLILDDGIKKDGEYVYTLPKLKSE